MRNFPRIFSLICLTFVLCQGKGMLFAQDFNDYQVLRCEGPIPEEFTSLSSRKVEEDLAGIEQEKARKERKTNEDFYLQSNFLTDELLTGGKVLFNDPVSRYLNKVGAHLLRNEPELSGKVRFYAIKSPSVNAFATNNGIIFVNLGLIAQLENEAQLAFILSHELHHFVGNHPLNKYVEGERQKQDKGLFGRISQEKSLLARNHYSRELETEADLEGLRFFAQSDYDPKEIEGVFDVLLYSYLPFDDRKFEADFLESEYLQFPETYFLEETAPIEADENYDDELATHPSIGRRRDLMRAEVKNREMKGKKLYLNGAAEFKQIRTITRFEISQLYLQNRNYEDAFYNSWLLLHDFPESKYLKKAIVKSLYGLAKYKNQRHFFDVHLDYGEVQGESQQVFHFFEQMTGSELTTIALREAWLLLEEYPRDLELKLMVEDLFREMGEHHREFARDLKRVPPESKDSLSAKEKEELSKYDKIRLESDDPALGVKGYIYTSCVDLFLSSDFGKRLQAALNASVPEASEDRRLSYRERRKQFRKARREGKGLGIDRLVMTQPIYHQVDRRKKIPVRYIASEKGLIRLGGMLEENAGMVGLDLQMLDLHSLKNTEVDAFNDYVMLNEWITEEFSHDEIDNFVNTREADARQMTEKYGTDYFGWTGTLTLTDRPDLTGGLMLFVLVLTAPLGIYEMLTPEKSTAYFTLVYNLKTGENKMASLRTFPTGPRQDVMHSNIYDVMLRLKTKTK